MAQPKDRMTPSRAILYAVILTALIAYFQAILAALGASDQRVISPLFAPVDLFADYFKLIGSYPAQAPIRLESWLPSGWATTIQSYLSITSYGSDPSLVGSRLTHFGMPPLAQVFYLFLRRIFFADWPFSSFLFCIAALVCWLSWCVDRSFIARRSGPWIVPAIALLYPFVFAITRGNIISCISSLSVISAFLVALRPNSPVLAHPLLLSLAIGVRPNNLLLLPLCSLIASLARPHLSRARIFGQNIIIVAAVLIGTVLSLPSLYPSFTFQRFLESYHWISIHYDLDPGNATYVSSPLQGLNLVLTAALGSSPATWLIAATGLLRMVLIGGGVILCLAAFHLCARRELSISRSILLSIVGMAIATPWFVDYHLLVLLAPLFCCALLDQTRREGLASGQSGGLAGSSPALNGVRLVPPTDCDASSGSELRATDYVLIIALLLPKSLPLLSTSATLGVLVNPLLFFAYAILMMVPRFRRLKAIE